jgi:hypothetical protein
MPHALSPVEVSVEQVADWLRVLVAPDQVMELRAIKVRRRSEYEHTVAGFFDADHLHEMAEAALELTPFARGTYFTLNPIHPQLLARRANRVDRAGEGDQAGDKHVLCRRWLLIDADPIRDSLISSTDTEKAHALDTVQAIRHHLSGRGWPEPILGDSGNGYHLLYRIDLPANDGGQVQRILQALADRFDTEHVKIDQTVFNPARIVKVPGTIARKGDNVRDRPHRRAMLLEVPG